MNLDTGLVALPRKRVHQRPVFFKIAGGILDVETIASGKGIRERRRLQKLYGGRRWRKLKGTAVFKLKDSTMCHAELHWYEAHLGNPMKRTEPRFVVCVKNRDYGASLELRKLYQLLSDKTAAKLHQVRVIDESGEDYLYPEEFFVAVQLTQSAEKAVLRAGAVGG